MVNKALPVSRALPVNRALSVAAGLVADRFLGEPPEALHPLPRFGSAMEEMERRLYRDTRASGVAYVTAGAVLGGVSGRLVRSVSFCTFLSVGANSLRASALQVSRALEAGDVPAARTLLPSLVGRNTTDLDEKEIARAVVESVAENTVDAVVAPVMWALLGGAPGTMAYRAVNTMDAMVGTRSQRYLRFGWASARADDLLGWIPARITALLVILLRPNKALAVVEVVRKQAPSHPSPNAGVAEGAFAAALGVRLGGENRYEGRSEVRPSLGHGGAPDVHDIEEAVILSRQVANAMAALLVSFALLRMFARLRARRSSRRRRLASGAR